MSRRGCSLVECLAEVVDPRIERTKRHRITDILALAVMAVIAGAEGWEDIEEFGRQKHDWLKTLLPLPHGIPSHDTISRLFRALRPGSFRTPCGVGWNPCMSNWV